MPPAMCPRAMSPAASRTRATDPPRYDGPSFAKGLSAMKTLAKLAAVNATAHKVLALTTPFFGSEQKWKARAMLVAIVLLNLAAVYMLVLINDWNRLFYDALEKHDQPVFWAQLLRFTYLAFGYIIVAVYKFYLTQLLEMRWRAWMTSHYLQ